MHSMSNQFYDYVSNKLFIYFENNQIQNGDKFFISFDEDNHVKNFYESLNRIAIEKNVLGEFYYKHPKGDVFTTYSILFGDIRLIVSENLSVSENFIVNLRNHVGLGSEKWQNTALLVICNDIVDSVTNGMRNLQNEGMPFSIKSISNNLEDEILSSKTLDKSTREILKFSINIKRNDIYQTTLWDYESVFSIIMSGEINSDDLYKLKLFHDGELENLKVPQIRSRLNSNHELFMDIERYSQKIDKKELLKEVFTEAGAEILSGEDWYLTDFSTVLKYKEKGVIRPLEYFENEEKLTKRGLTYWERPKSNTKAGRRHRHIIIFNDKNVDRITLDFSFNQRTRSEFIADSSKKFAKAIGNKLRVDFEVSPNKPTFRQINYHHNNKNHSHYYFNIVVLNDSCRSYESIKLLYQVNKQLKKIILTKDEDSDDIIFGIGKNLIKKSIEFENEEIILSDEDSILISDNSPGFNEGFLRFKLKHKDNSVNFEIQEQSKKGRPVKSSFIWSLKRQNHESFTYNGTKIIQGVNSFYLEEKFKDFIEMEQEIIANNIYSGVKDFSGKISPIKIELSDRLKSEYDNITDYYKDNNLLPSLTYLNDDLAKLYERFLIAYNEEIESIEEDTILYEHEDKKDIFRLGRIEFGDKITYSSLSPLNMAYQLEIKNQLGHEDISTNIADRLLSNNLMPYISSDDGNDLFRPVYQDYVHEWVIYEKSKNVSVGTTNEFIANTVSEKLNQFVKHFPLLFDINNNSPIKINLININDDAEVVKGIFNFIRSRLPDKVKTKSVIPVEVNIYNSSSKSNFDILFKCTSKEEIYDSFGIRVKSTLFDQLDIINMIQNNINYYKHSNDANDYEYAHISFFKVKSQSVIARDNTDKIDTGLSLNGLLSSVTSVNKHSEYRLGFGSKDILNHDNILIRTAISSNELIENSKNYGKNTYSKNKSLITTVEIEDNNLDNLFKKSHWITFIEPAFGIEYFEKYSNIILIHFSDQYSSSTKYDTITVTNKSYQYENLIKKFLKENDVEASFDDIKNIIRIFNSINGEWLLNIVSNTKNYDKQKLTIISAIKYMMSILDHDEILWVPVAMDEIFRTAHNTRLDKEKGEFFKYLKHYVKSDDLLFMGLKFNDKDNIELIYYPVEVNTNSLSKKNNYHKVYDLFRYQFKKIGDSGRCFTNKFFRNLFIQIFLSNAKKFVLNEIWDEKDFSKVDLFKSKLLNDDYEISYGLEDYICRGSAISFSDEFDGIIINKNDDELLINIPQSEAYYALVKSIEDIKSEVQLNDGLISQLDLNDIKHKEFADVNDEEIFGENVYSEDESVVSDVETHVAESRSDVSNVRITDETDLEDMRFIRKSGKKYEILKTIRGNKKYFGSYETLEDAIMQRNYLVNNNWGLPEGELAEIPRKEGKYGKYISKNGDYFIVIKYINGKYQKFGVLKSVEDAVILRDALIENDWDINKIPKELLTTSNRPSTDKRLHYISKIKGKYMVSKKIDGEMKTFGVFDTKEEAIAERDYLIAINWPVEDEISEEEKIDEYVYLVEDEYIVKNVTDGEEKIFGKFDEMGEAIRFRNLCVKTNWKP